jgi:hypothetical protein
MINDVLVLRSRPVSSSCRSYYLPRRGERDDRSGIAGRGEKLALKVVAGDCRFGRDGGCGAPEPGGPCDCLPAPRGGSPCAPRTANSWWQGSTGRHRCQHQRASSSKWLLPPTGAAPDWGWPSPNASWDARQAHLVVHAGRGSTFFVQLLRTVAGRRGINQCIMTNQADRVRPAAVGKVRP